MPELLQQQKDLYMIQLVQLCTTCKRKKEESISYALNLFKLVVYAVGEMCWEMGKHISKMQENNGLNVQ